jgi:hypothetical protein
MSYKKDTLTVASATVFAGACNFGANALLSRFLTPSGFAAGVAELSLAAAIGALSVFAQMEEARSIAKDGASVDARGRYAAAVLLGVCLAFFTGSWLLLGFPAACLLVARQRGRNLGEEKTGTFARSLVVESVARVIVTFGLLTAGVAHAGIGGFLLALVTAAVAGRRKRREASESLPDKVSTSIDWSLICLLVSSGVIGASDVWASAKWFPAALAKSYASVAVVGRGVFAAGLAAGTAAWTRAGKGEVSCAPVAKASLAVTVPFVPAALLLGGVGLKVAFGGGSGTGGLLAAYLLAVVMAALCLNVATVKQATSKAGFRMLIPTIVQLAGLGFFHSSPGELIAVQVVAASAGLVALAA